MAAERTLSIIKPDATRRNLTGRINARFEEAGLRIVAQKRLRLTRARPRRSMPSTRSGRSTAPVRLHDLGPVVAQVLEGETRSQRTAR